eukprot:351879-Pelagomonas_calceolata.AAC.1
MTESMSGRVHEGKVTDCTRVTREKGLSQDTQVLWQPYWGAHYDDKVEQRVLGMLPIRYLLLAGPLPNTSPYTLHSVPQITNELLHGKRSALLHCPQAVRLTRESQCHSP